MSENVLDRVGDYPLCMKGTRQDIFDSIYRWLDEPDGPNILLIR
jgi:hypothetical protein